VGTTSLAAARAGSERQSEGTRPSSARDNEGLQQRGREQLMGHLG
jgi:hypothetical protein